ncbi:MAG: helix-turn-helix transcriptional regulator [Burkholderiales bacterium]|nr:helix-turn-helix transcriptional regulator [Burkholderiales bacterium]
MQSNAIRFDSYELQPQQRRLLHAGVEVPLRSRAFEVLLVLAERAGELVTKSDLLDRVWEGLVVEENNIASQVATLRKALDGPYIATVPGHGYRFTAVTRAAAEQPAATRAEMPTTTSARSSSLGPTLFGRAADAHALAQALRAGVCVTLVGAGGVGKTALAQAVAAAWNAGRMSWVDLAALSDVEQLPLAIGRALELQTTGGDVHKALVQALADGSQLLVFDNAEHLVDGVAAWARRLGQAVPGLALLVTSQLPLRVAGEQLMALEPLALPAPDAGTDEMLASGAVAMLADRIRAADPRFALGAGAVPLLRRIGERLDGLPLALEMAAARVPILGLQGLLDALDDRLKLLTRGRRQAPQRHETLRAALEWSHGLLDEPERQLFRRLGVFAAEFSLDLAVDVGGDDGADRWETVDHLSVLVERCLVASLHADPPRYRLLETLRSYAAEQLQQSGESDAVRRRLVQSLAALMANHERGAAGPRTTAALGLVGDALNWARAADPSAAFELTLAAAGAATFTNWLPEAEVWIMACEPLVDSVAPALAARWWRDLARFDSYKQGGRVVEAARRSYAIERERGNDDGLFWSLIQLLRAQKLTVDDAETCRIEAQAISDRHPEWPAYNRVMLHSSLAFEYTKRGDHDARLAQFAAAFELAREAGLTLAADAAESNIANTLLDLGRPAESLERIDALLGRMTGEPTPNGAYASLVRMKVLTMLGRIDEVAAFAPQALHWCRRFDIGKVFYALSWLATCQGRHRAAVQQIGYLRHWLSLRDAVLDEDDEAWWPQSLRAATEALGAATVESLLERGARLDAAAADRLLSEDMP